MGLSNYYRRFISNYAQIAEPLHRLLRKSSKSFNWTPECEASFHTLKAKLTSPPILAFRNFANPFIVSTDVSDKAIGGVLSQLHDGQDRVLAYWSRQLSKAERNYSTTECEALAAVGATKEFYPYLYGFPFKLITDHNPLTSLKDIKDTGGALHVGYFFCNSSTSQLSIRREPNTLMQIHYQDDLQTILRSLWLKHALLLMILSSLLKHRWKTPNLVHLSSNFRRVLSHMTVHQLFVSVFYKMDLFVGHTKILLHS